MRTKIRGKNFPPAIQEIIVNAAVELRHNLKSKHGILVKTRKRLMDAGFKPPDLEIDQGELILGKILAPNRKALVETAFQTQNIDRLGKGGINIVNLLQEVLSGLYITERVAYKKEYKSFLENDDKKIFLNACRRLIRLPAHPNVVQFLVYGHKMNRDTAFIFEYAPGQNLKQFLENDRVTLTDFLQLAIKGLRGIRHLHEHGLVHCDIKPENFCISRNGAKLDVNLIDFDFTRDYKAYIRDIKLKKIPGTIRFLPGEVAFPNKIPTEPGAQKQMAFAYDTYAFGITLYYLLTKSYPPEFSINDTKLILIRKANKFIKNQELKLPIPEGKSKQFHKIMDIIKQMVQSNWECRPSPLMLSVWLSEIQPSEKPIFSDFERDRAFVEITQEKVKDTLGEYLVVTRQSNLPYRFPDGTKVRLALLKDKHDLRYLGIPNQFKTKKEAQLFYQKRSLFLTRLNEIREKYRDLFPGKYNIVLEFGQEVNTVWTIRPFLDGVITLKRYMELAPQRITKPVLFKILINISRSLGALNEAGYIHSNLDLSTIFMVPPFHQLAENTEFVQESMILDTHLTVDTSPQTEDDVTYDNQLTRLEPMNQIDLPHTIELMDLNNSRPLIEGECDPNVEKFLDIMSRLFTLQKNNLNIAALEMIQHFKNESKNTNFTWDQVTMWLVNHQPGGNSKLSI